jgi:hypothetical protein
MDGVTDEKVVALLHERDTKQRDYDDLVQTGTAKLWMRDLDALEHAYSSLLEKQRIAAELALSSAKASTASSDRVQPKVKKMMIVKKKIVAGAGAGATI